MALQNRTQQERLNLANALAKAEKLVRDNVNRLPVNYPTTVDAALTALKTQLDATVSDSTPAGEGI